MNSFVLMATVIREPELRFTKEKQTPVCEFLVEFPGLRDDSPKESLKVVGWGNLANTIKDSYHPGDRLIIEGRLGINTVERPEGFKEKRAELTASRISLVDGDNAPSSSNFSSGCNIHTAGRL
jgi:single-stranded DNA-binding protein